MVNPDPWIVIEVSPVPAARAAGESESTDPAGFRMLMVALDETDGSEMLKAWTATVLGDGGIIGGVYNPLPSIVPTEEFPPAEPLTDQAHLEPASPFEVTVN